MSLWGARHRVSTEAHMASMGGGGEMMVFMHARGAALLKNLPPSTYLDPRAQPTACCPYRSPSPTPEGPYLEEGELWSTKNYGPQVLENFLPSHPTTQLHTGHRELTHSGFHLLSNANSIRVGAGGWSARGLRCDPYALVAAQPLS